MGKSIDFGGNTFLDSSAVAVNSQGKTLQQRLGEIDNGQLTDGSKTVNSEAEINAIINGTTVMRNTSSISIGGITIPSYSRMLKINYSSTDCAILGVTSSRQIISLYRNNGTWTGRLV